MSRKGEKTLHRIKAIMNHLRMSNFRIKDFLKNGVFLVFWFSDMHCLLNRMDFASIFLTEA